MIVIGTIAYNSLTTRLVESVLAHSDVHLIIHVHSEEQVIQPALAVAETAANVSLHNHGSNRGVARSWNDIIVESGEIGCKTLIICNDDVVFTDGDIDKLAEKAQKYPDRYMVSCAGWHDYYQKRVDSHGYSCFVLNPVAVQELGYFDENFVPAYFEDTDHHRRASLSGLVEENVPDTGVIHLGSNSIRYNKELEKQNVYTFTENRNYYMDKWGGTPGNELFKRPFNDPDTNYMIPKARRHSPYGPSRDRTSMSVADRFKRFI